MDRPKDGTGVQLDSLTSMRFFAALVVFLLHVSYLWSAGTRHVGDMFARQGAVGVSFFFLLSGFVLAWSQRADDTPRAFYRRRVARIVPAYWVAAIGALLVLQLEYGGGTTKLGQALFSFSFLQAWIPDEYWFSGGDGPAWSLSTEAFFYALFPLMIVAVGRLGRTGLVRLLVALVALAVLIPVAVAPTEVHSGVGYWLIYICPAVRIIEFAAGAVLARLLIEGVRLRLPITVAVAITLGAYVAAAFVPVYLRWVATTIVPFGLLIFTLAEADLVGRRSALRHRWLVKLGQWSYAFYLVHQLVIRVIANIINVRMPDLGAGERAVAWIAALPLSVLAAYLLFSLVERPLEARIRRGGGQTPLPASMAEPVQSAS